MKKLFLIFLALPLFGQTTYTSSKYKPVWYSSTYEKTHGTYALFDTSSIKAYFTPLGKPEWKMIGPTANTLFYVDSTGTLQTGTVANALLKVDFGDSLGNYEGWGIDILNNDNIHVDSVQVPSIYMHNLKLARTEFDDSLNNAHTITGAWKFSGTLGSVPAGRVGIGSLLGDGYIKITADDNDTLTITTNGSTSDISSTSTFRFIRAGINKLQIAGAAMTVYSDIIPGTDKTYCIGSNLLSYDKIFSNEIRSRDTDSDTFAVNPKGFSATNTMATGAIALQLKDGATNLFNVDTTGLGTFAQGIVINNTSTAPTGVSGRMYYQGINNADADTLFFYNGTAWKQFVSE